MQEQFRKAGVQIVAVSADPPQRSTMLARFVRTQMPLLSDPEESLLVRWVWCNAIPTASPTAQFRLSFWSIASIA